MPYKTYQQPATKRTTRGSAAEAPPAAPQAPLADMKCEDTDVKMEVNEPETGNQATTEGENGVEKKKPWLQRTKDGGVKKVPKDVQKRRRNYRLKKMLAPKAPIMVLHELLGHQSVNYELLEPGPPAGMRNMPHMYTARAMYENQTFTGMGPSKSIAKNVCAEYILQYITTQSCMQKENEKDQENGNPNSKKQLVRHS